MQQSLMNAKTFFHEIFSIQMETERDGQSTKVYTPSNLDETYFGITQNLCQN